MNCYSDRYDIKVKCTEGNYGGHDRSMSISGNYGRAFNSLNGGREEKYVFFPLWQIPLCRNIAWITRADIVAQTTDDFLAWKETYWFAFIISVPCYLCLMSVENDRHSIKSAGISKGCTEKGDVGKKAITHIGGRLLMGTLIWRTSGICVWRKWIKCQSRQQMSCGKMGQIRAIKTFARPIKDKYDKDW